MNLRPTQQEGNHEAMPCTSQLPGVSEVMDLGGDSTVLISGSENGLYHITNARSKSIVKVGRACSHGGLPQKESDGEKGGGMERACF